MRRAQGGGCAPSWAAYGRDRPRERQVPVPFAAVAQITRVLVWLEFWLNENGCRFSNLEIWPEEPKGWHTLKARNSLRALKQKSGSVVVRRGRRVFVVNRRNPRWNTRQG
jgi:large subunit ribosomal protein L36